MSRQLGQFRIGSRAEYLFASLLSRYCQVVPVPRQEDYGEDFVCSTLLSAGRMVLQGVRFRVQVKSSVDAVTEPFGGVREGRDYIDDVRWLLGRPPFYVAPEPLLFAVSSPDAGTLDLYLPQHIWEARYRAGTPTEMVFSTGTPRALGRNRRAANLDFASFVECSAGTKRVLGASAGDGRRWTIPLGAPIVSLPHGQATAPASVPAWFHEVLAPWVRIEQLNRAMAALNIPVVWHYDRWTTNEPPEERDLLNRAFWSTTPGQNVEQIEELAHALLACLHGNYTAQDDTEAARAIKRARDTLGERVADAHPDQVRGRQRR